MKVQSSFLETSRSDPAEAVFEADLGYRLIYSRGALDQLGDAVAGLSCKRPLLVSDPGVRQAGHVDRALQSLRRKGLETLVLDRVEENPTSPLVSSVAQSAEPFKPDLIVGLGGGSAMDCAKGVNFILTSGGRMEDYWGFEKPHRPLLPSIGIPTTAGTGSEAQSYALITQEETGRKMACGSRQARFRTVLLDPDLVATVPVQIMALSAVDALSHALESHVSTKATAISRLFSRQAWLWIEANLQPSLEGPGRNKARARMLLAAHLAGLAIEHSMLGAAHACANPLTACFSISHGAAVGLMLPHVIRFNRDAAQEGCRELRSAVDPAQAGNQSDADWLAQRVIKLAHAAGLPGKLREYSVEREDLPKLALRAADEWTGKFNPRRIEKDDFERLYEKAY